MNKTLMAAGLAVILGACSSSKKSDVAEGATPNPFFAEYTTPFGVPPFDQIGSLQAGSFERHGRAVEGD